MRVDLPDDLLTKTAQARDLSGHSDEFIELITGLTTSQLASDAADLQKGHTPARQEGHLGVRHEVAQLGTGDEPREKGPPQTSIRLQRPRNVQYTHEKIDAVLDTAGILALKALVVRNARTADRYVVETGLDKPPKLTRSRHGKASRVALRTRASRD